MHLPPDETIKWLALLAAALLLTSFGTTFPNRFNQQRSPRSHNGVRLLNECLARAQLAIFNYFLAFGITASLAKHQSVKYWIPFIVVLSTYSYASSVAASIDLDIRLKQLHSCRGTPIVIFHGDEKTATSGKCDHSIGFWEFVRLSARYFISAGSLFALAVYFAFVAGQ